MVDFNDEMRLKMARIHLQHLADEHDGILINGNISKVAKDSGLTVTQLKNYLQEYPIGRNTQW